MPFLFPIFAVLVGIYFGFDLSTLKGIAYSFAATIGIGIAAFASIALLFRVVEGDDSHV